MDNQENPASAVPPKISPLKPIQPVAGGPKPITIKLQRPVAPAAPKPAAAAPAAPTPVAPTAPTASPLKPIAVPKPVIPGAAATPLKPVAPSASAPAATPAPAPAAPLKPVAVVPPKPAATPTSAAQTQAAKSKTSRISLDSAIGVAPGMNSEAKTIVLKRPTDLGPKPKAPASPSSTAPIRSTSRIDVEAATNGETSVTKKATLRVKRPTALKPLAPVAEENNEDTSVPEEALGRLKPIPADFQPEDEGAGIGTKIAIVVASLASILLILLSLCLASQAMGPNAGPNSLASISGPSLPCLLNGGSK